MMALARPAPYSCLRKLSYIVLPLSPKSFLNSATHDPVGGDLPCMQSVMSVLPHRHGLSSPMFAHFVVKMQRRASRHRATSLSPLTFDVPDTVSQTAPCWAG